MLQPAAMVKFTGRSHLHGP
jgi:hypothetical protein